MPEHTRLVNENGSPVSDPPISVLYVDDEQDLLMIGKVFLERAGGFRVSTITSAKEALNSSSFQSYDAIVSDYQMPEMDGIEFLKAVREQYGAIPFILFTGRGREEVVIEALNNGADFYLQKGGDPPSQFAELANMIRRSVSQERAEKSLRESEEKFRVLAETAHVAIIMYQDSRYVYVNEHTCNATGYSRDELYSMNVWEVLHPDSQDMAKSRGLARMQGEDIASRYDVKYVTKSGEVRWADLTAGTIQYRGKPAVIILMVGITERKAMEEELRGAYEHLAAADKELQLRFDELKESRNIILHSEQQYRSIFEHLDGAYFRTDLAGNLVMISPLFVEQFGFSDAADIIGRNIRTDFYPDSECYDAFLTKIEKDGQIREERAILKRSDGSPVVVSVSGHLLRDSSGNPEGIEGIAHNISDLARTEEALRKSEERYREMAERSSDLIIILNQDMSATYVSPSARAIIGYDPEEMVGKPMDFAASTIFSQSGPDLFRAAEMTMNGNVVENVEIQICKKDGTLIFVNLNAVPTIHDGVVDGAQVSMRDITRAKTMEMALKESEAKFRRFAENAQDLIYRMSIPEMRFEYVNPASVALTGYTPEEFYADPTLISRLIHPSMEDYFSEQREKLKTHTISLINEFRITDRSGKPRWLHHRKALVTDENNNLVAIEGILTDVTRYKSIEGELRETEQRFLAATLNTRSFVWEIDREGVITYASPAIEDVLGVRPEEAVGKIRYFDLLDPSVSEDLKSAIMNVFRDLKSFRDFDAVCRHKDGSLVIVKVSGTPVFDETGLYAGYCGIGQDITKEKEAENKLAESEAKYRLLADNVHDIIWTADKTLHFTYVSPSITEFLGYTQKEALEYPFSYYLAPGSVPVFERFREQLVDAIQNGDRKLQNKELNLEFRRKDGSTVWTEIYISLIYDGNKKFDGIVGVTRNISRRREAEDALKEANRQLGLISGITRHDILNKITPVLGYLTLLREEITDPESVTYLTHIERGIRAIKTFIEFTRYYEDLGSAEPAWQNLNTIMDLIHVPGQITLDTDLKNYSVLADPMLEKVFFNLLDNSLRHGETVSGIWVSAEREGDDLIVVWEDNGVGIAENDKVMIFERGFGKNTGLGMFLVREILSLTDISITENGKPGEGVRFEVTVPKGRYKSPDTYDR